MAVEPGNSPDVRTSVFLPDEIRFLQGLADDLDYIRLGFSLNGFRKIKSQVAKKFGERGESVIRRVWRAMSIAVGEGVVDTSNYPGIPSEPFLESELRLLATIPMGVSETAACGFVSVSKGNLMRLVNAMLQKINNDVTNNQLKIETSYQLSAWVTKNRGELGIGQLMRDASKLLPGTRLA